jgi:drug/metabolite transporter (DMT)-like permease
VLAVGLGILSGAAFGALAVSLRFALRRESDPILGAFVSTAIAAAVCAVASAGSVGGDVVPFVLAGLVAPGLAQVTYTWAIREAGPSRAAIASGLQPVFAAVIAILLLDEPLRAPLAAGALLVVLGGAALVRERVRPEHFRWLGVGLAFVTEALFAARDNLLRWLAGDTDVDPLLASAVSLGAGAAVMALVVARPGSGLTGARFLRALPIFAPAGLLFGLAWAALVEAFYRGKVTVVSPLIATHALWAIAFSALLIRRSEAIGRHVLAGAALVVAGGALIGVFR